MRHLPVEQSQNVNTSIFTRFSGAHPPPHIDSFAIRLHVVVTTSFTTLLSGAYIFV